MAKLILVKQAGEYFVYKREDREIEVDPYAIFREDKDGKKFVKSFKNLRRVDRWLGDPGATDDRWVPADGIPRAVGRPGPRLVG